jgi:23S rRNA pseudouridine2457 synthase
VPFILLNKPFNVLSQFRDENGRGTLADFVTTASVYPAGRLDYDSEGLILLTNDGKLQARVSSPKYKISKSYWVQAEGIVDTAHVEQLISGVQLKDGLAMADRALPMAEPDGLWPRDPPIRERRNVPTSWLEIAVSEGRNRQVRRMTAAAGLPTLRLIRHRIGPWSLTGLSPGESREISNKEAWQELTHYLECPQ